MSHRTLFAGLAAPDLGENAATVLNGDFIYTNPDLIDQFLRIGAKSHRHDAHASLQDPYAAPALGLGSGGTFPSDTEFFITYTLSDLFGGETAPAQAASVTVGGGVDSPSTALTASAGYGAGIMPDGSYAYAYTYTDGLGGETTLSPVTWIYLEPGHASAQVAISGLAQGEPPTGNAVQWRLWRSYEGADWHLVSQGSSDTFIDSGFDPPDNPARPPALNTTSGSANAINVTLPTASAEPAMTSAAAINVYISTSEDFPSPSLYASVTPASAGHTFTIYSYTTSRGSPPPISTSIGGANRILGVTDIIDWQTFTASAQGALPGSADARGALVFQGAGGATVTLSSLGGGSALVTITAAAGTPDVDTGLLEASAGSTSEFVSFLGFAGSGGTSVALQNIGGGSGVVIINASGAAGPQGATGATGATGAAGAAGAAGTTASFRVTDGPDAVVPVSQIRFAASGEATVGVSDQTGGSALVTIYAPTSSGGGGGTGANIAVTDGPDVVNPASQIKFVASGEVSVGVANQTGGSAQVTIYAPTAAAGSTSFVASAGSASATVTSFLGFAGSGETQVELLSYPGGSSVVLISAPTTASFPLNYRGDYGSLNSYAVNDVVRYGNRLWRANVASSPAIAAFRAKSSFVTGTSTFNVTIPASVVVGDILLLAVDSAANGGPATPAGWSQVGSTQTSGVDNEQFKVFSRTAQAGDAGTNVSVAVSNSSVAAIYAYLSSGVDTFAQSGTGTSPAIPPDANTSERQVAFVGVTGGSTFSGAPTFAAGGNNQASNNTSFAALAAEDFSGAVGGQGGVTAGGGGSLGYLMTTVALQNQNVSFNTNLWDVIATVNSVSDGVAADVVNPVTQITFAASGAASVGVGNATGGSATVTMYAPPSAAFVASGGSTSVNVGPYLGFAGSGGVMTKMTQVSGSAVLIIGGTGMSAIPSTQQSGNWHLVLGDAGTVVEGTSGSSQTFTIDPSSTTSFPVGTIIEVFQYGAGQITIAGGTGVTLRSDASKVKTAAQYATIQLRQRATDEWVLSGDLA